GASRRSRPTRTVMAGPRQGFPQHPLRRRLADATQAREATRRLLVPTVLGINAVFHDPAAALVIDGCTVAAAEEERFSRRKHGKPAVPFATWELPERAIRWCLAEAGVDATELDAVTYSYDPRLAPPRGRDVTADAWEDLRTLYAERADRFLTTVLPGFDPA